jgi:phosphate transport system substrate-binding protein
LNLSGKRAQILANEIIAATIEQQQNFTVSSVCFGELAPSACNDTDEGRRINRRVKAWIKTPRQTGVIQKKPKGRGITPAAFLI